MEDKESKKIEETKESIKKLIDKMYNTMSINQETQANEELNSIVKKTDKNVLVELAGTLDTFGKCVLYYKTPIELRLELDFINATKVSEEERLSYWKEYKQKLKAKNFNLEEEYNKIIMMACILHVPIEESCADGED